MWHVLFAPASAWMMPGPSESEEAISETHHLLTIKQVSVNFHGFSDSSTIPNIGCVWVGLFTVLILVFLN